MPTESANMSSNTISSPAGKKGANTPMFSLRDVNKALSLNEAWPNICQALAGRKFRELAQDVHRPSESALLRVRPRSSASICAIIASTGPLSTSCAIGSLHACPDFQTFVKPGTGWAKDEKAYKLAASERVRAAACRWWRRRSSRRGPFLRYSRPHRSTAPWYDGKRRTRSPSSIPSCLVGSMPLIGRLVRSDEAAEQALAQAFDALDVP